MATYFKQKKGWSFLIWVTNKDGERVQKRYSGYPTKKEAELNANKIAYKVSKSTYIEPSTQTVKEYMWEWFNGHSYGLKPTTIVGYKRNINGYITPYLGKLRLCDLKPNHVQNMIRSMHNSKLKTRTIIYARGVLRKALNDALRLEIIEKNPALYVDIPKGPKYQAQYYNDKEIIKLINIAEGKSILIPILLGAGLGLRRGEVLGLQWGDVDLDNKLITIKRAISSYKDGEFTITEPKSETSKRQICCPDFILQVLKKEYISRTNNKGVRRIVMCSEYVCITEEGYQYTPSQISRKFNILLKKNELKHIRFHDLRHSCASLLLKSGVNMKTTSMILGHSSIGITMDLYSHIDIEQKIDAAERINNILQM